MDSILIPLIGGFAFGLGVLVTLACVYAKGDEFVHRMRYKVWTLPCPNCRDENDKPTGEVTPSSPTLKRMAQQATESGKLPTFPCQVCNGSKVVRYEFPRHRPPTINERNILVSSYEVGQYYPEERHKN